MIFPIKTQPICSQGCCIAYKLRDKLCPGKAFRTSFLGEVLVYSICWFLWFKYFHHGWFLATNMMSVGSQNFWRCNSRFLWASVSRPQCISDWVWATLTPASGGIVSSSLGLEEPTLGLGFLIRWRVGAGLSVWFLQFCIGLLQWLETGFLGVTLGRGYLGDAELIGFHFLTSTSTLWGHPDSQYFRFLCKVLF